MSLKILHIIHSLRMGGLENGTVNLINHLDNNKFKHAVCCIDSSGSLAEKIIKGVEIFSLGKGDRRDYLLPLKIANVVKDVRPDIVHTRNWAAIDGVIGAKLAGVKHVIHGEHGREATDPTGTNRIRRKVRKALNPWVSKFIAVSVELKNWLINDVGIRREKVLQIINGVDIERFKPAENKELSKERFGLEPDSFVVGIVGRFDPVKDHETLFKAFRIVCDSNSLKKLILIVAGSGPLQESLKVLAEDLNISKKILFMGQQNNINRLYNYMDVYVLPSIAEGISNSILEAMACGLPVITTRVGGNHELVEDGKTGYIFTPGDYKELAEKLFYYSNNSSVLGKHGFNGRVKAKERFSLSRMVKEYAELYESLSHYT